LRGGNEGTQALITASKPGTSKISTRDKYETIGPYCGGVWWKIDDGGTQEVGVEGPRGGGLFRQLDGVYRP